MAAVISVPTMKTALTASAESEKTTPSGIAYEDIGSSIDSFIKERKAGLASCEVSVFDREGVIYNGFYGYSDIENSVPADEETVYEWASTSKVMVWTSVMQQWERGNMDLEADIRTYLPDGFLTKLQYPEEKITMLDLMSHRAGFQESFYENQEAAPDDVYDSLEEAVRACECWQAFHVGEYTAYSNWSTALAAYIVEQTSGEDYVTYVHENIFEPLGMEHSSIEPRHKDNEWVDSKRSELKIYSRYADEKYNEDYGEYRCAVQLFPAGACMSTLDDLSTFGQAFVAEDCPLFENNSTREEMFRATSFYGDTDTAKNCHGLWTEQRMVQTLGHDGNSACTATFEFDPASGLGVVIMTNEPGETAFCRGIPVLLFGSMSDREEVRGYDGSGEDISGVYYNKRSICDGAASAVQYTGEVFPLSRNDDGSYSVSLFGISFADGFEFTPVGRDQYIMKGNGLEMFVYIRNGLFEMGYMDYVRSSTGAAPTAVNFGFMLFGLVCLVTFLIKLTAFIIRRMRRSERKYTSAGRLILAQQMIYGVSGVIYFLFILAVGNVNRTFLAVSAVLAAVLGLVSLANCGLLCYNTIKEKANSRTAVKQLLWAALAAAYALFILVMQFYCFRKL